MFLKQESAILKFNYTIFFIDTQVTFVIEAIRGGGLPDYFLLYLRG